VCTDSLGNLILVRDGNATSSYTGCAAPASEPPPNITQVCMDSLGNPALVPSGGVTTGYTNCGTPPPALTAGGPGGLSGPGGASGPPPAPGGSRAAPSFPFR
jgi:hypothetical protein